VSALPPFAAAIRRRLLAKGLTIRPTCEGCRREVDPRDLQAGLCRPCKSERDEASAYFEQALNATLSHEPSAPDYPIFGGPEAERPFLVEDDEDYWTRQQRLAEDQQAHDAAEDWDRNAEAEKDAMEAGDVAATDTAERQNDGEEGPF
jgi:hypothetical protein